jgi:hypothetical protein
VRIKVSTLLVTPTYTTASVSSISFMLQINKSQILHRPDSRCGVWRMMYHVAAATTHWISWLQLSDIQELSPSTKRSSHFHFVKSSLKTGFEYKNHRDGSISLTERCMPFLQLLQSLECRYKFRPVFPHGNTPKCLPVLQVTFITDMGMQLFSPAYTTVCSYYYSHIWFVQFLLFKEKFN